MTGSEYMGLVSALPCAICALLGRFTQATEIHHRRSGTGAGRRASDFDTISLCTEHHRGNTGIHGLGTKRFPIEYGITEDEIIAATRIKLGITEEEVEVWKQAERDKRRKVSKPKGGAKASRATRDAAKWPNSKIVPRGSV